VAEVRFTARSYYSAAQECLQMAVRLMRAKEYVAAHFYAGTAVECILRAHSPTDTGTFDSSHSIEYWSRKARDWTAGSEATGSSSAPIGW
jgi:HEPN domain-containing protein